MRGRSTNVKSACLAPASAVNPSLPASINALHRPPFACPSPSRLLRFPASSRPSTASIDAMCLPPCARPSPTLYRGHLQTTLISRAPTVFGGSDGCASSQSPSFEGVQTCRGPKMDSACLAQTPRPARSPLLRVFEFIHFDLPAPIAASHPPSRWLATKAALPCRSRGSLRARRGLRKVCTQAAFRART